MFLICQKSRSEILNNGFLKYDQSGTKNRPWMSLTRMCKNQLPRHWRRRKKKIISTTAIYETSHLNVLMIVENLHKAISADTFRNFAHFVRSTFAISRFPTTLEISRLLACDSVMFEFMNPIFVFVENVFGHKNVYFSWRSRDWHILLVIAAKRAAICLIINEK